MELTLRLWDPTEEVPWELLLLADPSRALVEAYMQRGLCFLAFLEGQLVGEFVLIHTHPLTIEIVNIAVKASSQGQGIGKQLVLSAIEEARKLGARTIEIGTGNSSLNQLKLYQRCGFRIFGIEMDYFDRNYEEPIVENGIPCRDMVRLRMDL